MSSIRELARLARSESKSKHRGPLLRVPKDWGFARPAETGHKVPFFKTKGKAQKLAETYRGGGNYDAVVVRTPKGYSVLVKGI